MDRSQKEEKWLAREIQLSQKHAELLAKREQLLHLSQSELNSSEHRAKVHQAHWTHVQQRNKQLLQDIKRSQVEMKDIARQPPNVKFTELQNCPESEGVVPAFPPVCLPRRPGPVARPRPDLLGCFPLIARYSGACWALWWVPLS
uniref:Uncharacterized protein n=1 Tax=Branchiostoma floridae TaxID=7739 RepID=C3XYN8_BRAFL|eukprot:XP_002610913.1 hypothetical protein BRAFLDRAFT_126294 [Branchiostoma floridae]